VSNLFHVDSGLHPWVGPDLGHSGSVFSIVRKHFEDEVFELVGKILATGLFPVGVVVSLEKQIVKIFVFLCLLEWENTLHNNEKYDAGGKHVDLSSIVGFAFFDLWGHISHGSPVRFEVVNFSKCGKSKISNLQIHKVVNQDIFKLQVSVNDSLAVHVFEDVAHLVQEEATTVLAHASQALADVEEKTAGNELEHNVNQVIDFSARWFDDLAIGAISFNLNNAVVFEALQNLDFCLHGFN